MRISCNDRMHAVLADLESHSVDGSLGFEFDVTEECIESWTHNYAIALVDIIEPDDAARDVFDLDAAIDKIVEIVAGHFGKTFEVSRKPVGDRVGQFVRIHRLGGGWEFEIEAYRRLKK